MSKFCTNCGTKLDDDVKFCTGCGNAVDGEKKASNKSTNNVTVNVTAPEKKSNGFAIAGFVISLVSTLLCCGMFNILGLIFSIIGLVKAKDYDGSGKGLAIAGIIICAVVMVASLIFYFVAMSTGAWNEMINGLSDI